MPRYSPLTWTQDLIAIVLITVISVITRLFIVDSLQVKNIKDKVVLITGADSGFGRVVIHRLLQANVTVFAGCQREESICLIEDENKDSNGVLEVFHMDVTNEYSVSDAKHRVSKFLDANPGKEFHAIVHLAQVYENCMIDDFLNTDSYRSAMETNFIGAVRVTQFFKDFLKKTSGRIVAYTSSAVRFPFDGFGPIVASKSALNGYMETLR
ncbi:hypothetical protein AB6A40_010148 [Gnathostoma spinigerum]|uniref:Uncharacterized protein n=1 Tax=Gnathostoma spinigerum TaxID=75299 RepID=A0ABD6EZ40_9BILA